MDCGTRLDLNYGGCNRGFQGTYTIDGPGSITWNLDSRACDNCQPNECTSASGLGLVIPVAFELQNQENFASTFTVTQAMVDAQVSPCQVGEEHFTLFSPGRP